MRRALPVLVALGAFGCGPGSSDVPFARDDHRSLAPVVEAGADAGVVDPALLPPDPLEAWDTAGAGPLTGVFALEAVVKAKVAGSLEVEERQLLRIRIVQRGRELHEKTTVCTLKLPVVKDVAELTIPQAMTDVLRGQSVEATGDFLSSDSPVGATWTPPPSPFLVGASLAHPDSDPLPTEAAPTGQADQDADGAPGVTVNARLVTCGMDVPERLYVALRTSSTISGTITSLDLIEGTDDVSLDLATLGSSDPACMAAAGPIASQIAVQPGSAITAHRLGDAQDANHDGNVSCAEIEAAAATLFGPYWAP